MPVHPKQVDLLANEYDTALISGGVLSVNGGDPTKFDVAAGTGIIVNNWTDPTNPTVTRVSWGASTALTPTGFGSTPASYVAIDSAGAVTQSTSAFTATQQRDLIILGALAHSGPTIAAATSRVNFMSSKMLDLNDLADAIGPINAEGNQYGPNGVNLNIDRSAGTTYARGQNYKNDPKVPSRVSHAGGAALSFSRLYNDGVGGFTFTAPTTTVDPDFYDDGSGTLAAMPVGEWQIQRLWMAVSNGATVVQYGEATFATAGEAQNAIGVGFTVPFVAGGWMLRGSLVVQEGATDLSDTATALFFEASRFGILQGASGGSSGGGAAGEANTASNQGAGGVGVFDTKVAFDLQFRNINTLSSRLSVALDAGNKEIDLDVVEANLDIGNQSGVLASDAAHGVRGGGTQHADAVAGGADGFMTGADKQKLDDYPTPTVDTDTTTDATITTISTIPLSDDTVYMVETRVVGRRTDSADRAVYIRRACVFREAAGAATLEGAVDDTLTRDSNNAWDADIDVSGNNVIITVEGDAGETVNWRAVTTLEQVA